MYLRERTNNAKDNKVYTQLQMCDGMLNCDDDVRWTSYPG